MIEGGVKSVHVVMADDYFTPKLWCDPQELKGQQLRVGTMDLKIAAIVLANSAVLLSRTLVDFRRVPNLKVEDWIS